MFLSCLRGGRKNPTEKLPPWSLQLCRDIWSRMGAHTAYKLFFRLVCRKYFVSTRISPFPETTQAGERAAQDGKASPSGSKQRSPRGFANCACPPAGSRVALGLLARRRHSQSDKRPLLGSARTEASPCS